MEKSKALANNTVILFIGTFFLKTMQYLLLPLYTTVLSTAEYGEVELVNTFVNLLVPIIGMQIDQGVFRFLIDARNSKVKIKKLVSSSIFFIILSSLAFSILLGLLNIFIKYDFMWFLILNMVFCEFSSLFLQLSRGLGKNIDYSIANIVTAIITAVFNILFILGLKMGAPGMLYGAALGYAAGIIYLCFKLKIHKFLSFKNIDKEALKKLLKYSLPMIPNSLSWWVFSSSDRVVVSQFIGASAVGILSVAYKFSMVGLLIFNVFNMSLTESISMSIEDDDIDDYFNRVFNGIAQIFTSFGGVLIAATPFVFSLMTGPDFADASGLIPIAIAATTLQMYAGMLGVVYFAKQNTSSIAMTSIVAAVINILTDIAMISSLGVYAAVISTLIAFLVLVIYRFIDVNKRYIKMRLNLKLLVNFVINFGVILGIFYLNNFYLNIFNLVLALGAALLFNKENGSFLASIIKDKIRSRS